MSRRTTNHRQWLGREGEAQAALFLETRGYRIIARNVRVDRIEIDLIARRGGLLVFVEVKSRRASCHGDAAEAVDERKQRRIRRGAHAWLSTKPVEARGTGQRRFDVVTCLLDANFGVDPDPASGGSRNEPTAPKGARWSIEHWEAAF